MVTYSRVKSIERDKEVKGEGKDMLTRINLRIKNYYYEIRRENLEKRRPRKDFPKQERSMNW